MKQTKAHNHIIDFLFPIILFFVFTISAVVVILLATRIYESTTTASSLNNVSRTSLSYVSEKIHHSDCKAFVSVTEIEGTDALALYHQDDKEGYTTYIYYHDGALKELFIKNQIEPALNMGNAIAVVSDFLVEQIEPDLYRLSCIDANGRSVSTVVGLHSYTER
ncbi:MAG: DUF4860 domain-containing protein [Lachnospiraceae bacterium]|nr:DUF4860 domain-containing protein [Lachnospiraceae bacterium]